MSQVFHIQYLIFFILTILQGGEPSEQHRELFPGSTALRPDEGISDQKTGEDDVSDGNDGNDGD